MRPIPLPSKGARIRVPPYFIFYLLFAIFLLYLNIFSKNYAKNRINKIGIAQKQMER